LQAKKISISFEKMEARLKEDIQREIKRYNNMLLVHDEIENKRVVPSWMSADDIKTPKEVFESLAANKYRVRYVRIPISPEQGSCNTISIVSFVFGD
jgi:hypothetical protein